MSYVLNKHFIGTVLAFSFFLTTMLFVTNAKEEFCYIENIGSNPPTLDPHRIDDVVSFRVGIDLYEGLVGYDQGVNLINLGAERYEISSDGKTYTFYLRKTAKWSNGDPVTAHDYVFSFQRALSQSTLASYSENLVDIVGAEDVKKGDKDPSSLGVKAIDDYTLEIKLRNRNKEFIHYLALFVAAPLHIKTVSKYGDAWASKVDTIVSNGAYKIVEWVTGGYIKLKKNEHYWNKDNVKIKNVKFIMVSSKTSDINNFRQGLEHVSLVGLPPVKDELYYKKQFGDQYVSYGTFRQKKLIFNLRSDKFKNVNVRKALSMTVNREFIVNIEKNGVVSYSPILENMHNGYFKNIVDEVKDYSWVRMDFEKRVEEAKKLLIGAGYSKKNPLRFTLHFSSTAMRSVADYIQQTWNSCFGGIVNCELSISDWTTHLSIVNNFKFDVADLGWIADSPLASNFSILYISSSNFNYYGYYNSKVDELYKDSLLADSDDDYLSKQRELCKIIMEDYASIIYLGAMYTRLVSNKIGGLDFSRNYIDHFRTADIYYKEDNIHHKI